MLVQYVLCCQVTRTGVHVIVCTCFMIKYMMRIMMLMMMTVPMPDAKTLLTVIVVQAIDEWLMTHLH